MSSKIQNKVLDAYCLIHFVILKFIISNFIRSKLLYANKNISVQLLTPKNSKKIFNLYQNHLAGDEILAPSILWNEEKIVRSFRYNIYLGIFNNGNLTGITRIFMKSWFTAELSLFMHKDFRNGINFKILMLTAFKILTLLKIRNAFFTTFNTNAFINKLSKLDYITLVNAKQNKNFYRIKISEALK